MSIPARGRDRRGVSLRLATLLVSGLLVAGAIESLARLSGRSPRREPPCLLRNEPVMLEPDPSLGWRTKPGFYRFPGYTSGASPITMTVWPNGSRATRPDEVTSAPRVTLVGDSFTHGWAVSDDETYGWKLQTRLPDVQVLNFGTAGYSTYQSLLHLQEHLAGSAPPTRVVVYGFNDDQERRNVGDISWVRLLASAACRGAVAVPFCLLDDGALARHAPEGYSSWPLDRWSAAVAFLEERRAELASRGRLAQARRVTERLIDELARTSAAAGADLVVLFLFDVPQTVAHYQRFLEARGIRSADCTYPVSASMVVAGEGHPNGHAHSRWAECAESVLAPLLAR